jgi:hypothetical protein
MVVRLIEIKPRFVASGQIDLKGQAMLMYRHQSGKGRVEEPMAQLQAVIASHTQVIAQIHVLKTSQLTQQPSEDIAPQVHTQGGTLQHQRLLVAIHREARQTITLGMHQA